MDARLRRIASDYEQIRKDFAGHKNIIVTPIGNEPPEKYHVTYFVNGIYLLEDGRIETLGRHEVEIILHADYPRYKPICKILTPIWHPNFRDGQICIGDIWGAGESLTDIIINIGDMIQYRSWNSFSPLSADAAQWAMDNKHLFPVGNVDLYIADYASAKDEVEIDLFSEDGSVIEEEKETYQTQNINSSAEPLESQFAVPVKKDEGNDFDITAEELEGIKFIPTAQRMQGAATAGHTVKVKINFKTVLMKGILWALVGSFIAFGLSELVEKFFPDSSIASTMGYKNLAKYYTSYDKEKEYTEKIQKAFGKYCKENGVDKDDEDAFLKWYLSIDDEEVEDLVSKYLKTSSDAEEKLYKAYKNDFNGDEDDLVDAMAKVTRYHTGIWAGVIALFIGLFLGIGEGVFYGSKQNAIKYAAIGAGVSLAIGTISGYLAQWMYASMLGDDPSGLSAAFVRALGWSIMGIGIGLSVGLIKPEIKRIISCTIGGFVGAFVGGFLFNYVCGIIPNAFVARGIAIVVMGVLIGVGVGLLEQFAKSAWLKVIRGEFEGKEYLVFPGTTSIGNNSKNTIVLFKDKLVGPHHCDIVMEGSKYVVVDCGTPMGTIVNGMKTNRHILRQGDAIAIGNSVLVFNTK